MSSNPFARTVVGQGGGGSRPTEAWRGTFDSDGNPIYEAIDWEGGKYVAPTTGQYDFAVVGYTEPKLDTSFANSKGDFVDKFSVELEIVSARGKGFRFFWGFQTPKISFGDKGYSPSNLGRIWTAAVGGGSDPEKGVEVGLDDLFGKPFTAYAVGSADKTDKGLPKYAKVTADTIQPVAAEGTADPFAAAMQGASAA